MDATQIVEALTSPPLAPAKKVYPMSVAKGRDGYSARTEIPLGSENRELHITTSKSSRGGIRCSASVVKVTRENGFSSISFMMYGDFNKPIVADNRVRCTEKTVRAMQTAVLADADAILNEALAFYAEKDAKKQRDDTAEAEAQSS